MSRAVLLVGHGTIEDPSDVAEFLRRIRHGRPAGAELVAEIERRYRSIGRSPLLDVTERVARALEGRLAMPVYVAMRFWAPLVADVLERAAAEGTTELVVLPTAPFSVHVYAGAASEAAAVLQARGARVPGLVPVEPFGSALELVAAHAAAIRPYLEGEAPGTTELVFTAHSLPLAVLARGDAYQRQFEASARDVAAALGWPATVAYQSEGERPAEWLGPTVNDALRAAQGRGARGVVAAPIGFLADHVETLYDLDVEAAGEARALGLAFRRVPALNDAPALVTALAAVAERAFAEAR